MRYNNYLEIIDLHKSKDFGIKKGKAKAISEKELNKPYYKWIDKQKLSRDFDTALEERINKPLENDMLIVRNPDGSIKFDDRKLRYDKYDLKDDSYTFYLGPSHFGENQSTNISCLSNKKLCQYFINQGIKNFNNKNAYFANIIATNVTLETKEDCVLIFKRSPESEIYANYWHVIGGHVDTDLEIFKEDNPSEYFRKILDERILSELEEELAIKPKWFSLSGFVHGVPGADFIYIAKTDKTADEILEISKHAKDKADHLDFKKLDPEELTHFLLTENKIVPVGFGSLLLYLKQKDRKLYENVKQELKI